MKVLLYTCITNNRDSLKHRDKELGVDYVCFSDKPFQDVTWEYRPVKTDIDDDPRRVARHYKTCIHQYAPGYDYYIWIDGSLKLIPDIVPMMEYLLEKHGDFKIACGLHPERFCAYDEARIVSLIKLDKPEVVDQQMRRYQEAGFPRDNGLHETGVVIRKNDQEMNRFGEFWWDEIKKGSKRDQLSFDYCLWKTKMECIVFPKMFLAKNKHTGGGRA